MGGRRGVYRVLVGKPGGKRPLGRPRHRLEDNIKTNIQDVGCCMNWIEVVHDRDRFAGTCECGNEPSGSIKRGGISGLAAKLLASEEGLCSME
jgi:hypothetical protein